MTFLDRVEQARAAADEAKLEWDRADAYYKELQAMMVPVGIDVSEHQGDIDWAKVSKAGFVFLRSSDGDYQDPRYTAARVKAVRSAGIKFGVYHFGRLPSTANGYRDGVTEACMAYYFARRAGWGPGDLRWAYDLERVANGLAGHIQDHPAGVAVRHVVEVITTYERITGKVPILYINPSTLELLRGNSTVESWKKIRECPLWIAHYNVGKPSIPGGGEWAFWQYSEEGAWAGILGKVDLNRFSGSTEDLEALVY